MEGARTSEVFSGGRKQKVAASGKDYERSTPKDPKAFGKLLKQLENQMLEHAKNLEFEEAAHVRDELQALRENSLLQGSGG